MELDRIFSHLIWIGTTAIDIGAFTVFLYTFQERERTASSPYAKAFFTLAEELAIGPRSA